jgi:hypothetical protein
LKHRLRVDPLQRRREEYPPIGDQLDAIWKMLDGKDLPAETAAMLQTVKSVKARFKK